MLSLQILRLGFKFGVSGYSWIYFIYSMGFELKRTRCARVMKMTLVEIEVREQKLAVLAWFIVCLLYRIFLV